MSLLVNRNRFGIGLIDTTKSAFYGWGVKGAMQAHLPSLVQGQVVSIHAPVKGATGRRHGRRQALLVSIHAPVKGATPVYTAVAAFPSFQSTRP